MSAIRALLTHYKWDYQRLIGEYYEYENDPAAFFEQAHVTNPFDLEMPKTATDSEDCKICYSEVSTDVSRKQCLYPPLFLLKIDISKTIGIVQSQLRPQILQRLLE